MLLRLCNFIHFNKTAKIMQKDEIYKVNFALNLQFLGCNDRNCLDDQDSLARQKKLLNLALLHWSDFLFAKCSPFSPYPTISPGSAHICSCELISGTNSRFSLPPTFIHFIIFADHKSQSTISAHFYYTKKCLGNIAENADY